MKREAWSRYLFSACSGTPSPTVPLHMQMQDNSKRRKSHWKCEQNNPRCNACITIQALARSVWRRFGFCYSVCHAPLAWQAASETPRSKGAGTPQPVRHGGTKRSVLPRQNRCARVGELLALHYGRAVATQRNSRHVRWAPSSPSSTPRDEFVERVHAIGGRTAFR